MGKGTSKAGSNGYRVTKVTTQSGVTIDLSRTPLIYGPKDPAISGTKRQNLETFEQNRVKNNIEYGIIFDYNGNQLGKEIKGTKNYCLIPGMLLVRGTVFSHNHPRGKGEEGCLGGTFSLEDIKTFTKRPMYSMRAAGAEGTYSITKTKAFNAKGLKQYMGTIEKKNDAVFQNKQNQLKRDYAQGKINGRTLLRRQKIAFNEYLIAQHNDLLAGQKQYGYTYVLEK